MNLTKLSLADLKALKDILAHERLNLTHKLLDKTVAAERNQTALRDQMANLDAALPAIDAEIKVRLSRILPFTI